LEIKGSLKGGRLVLGLFLRVIREGIVEREGEIEKY
jgi:hypothetical protein